MHTREGTCERVTAFPAVDTYARLLGHGLRSRHTQGQGSRAVTLDSAATAQGASTAWVTRWTGPKLAVGSLNFETWLGLWPFRERSRDTESGACRGNDHTSYRMLGQNLLHVPRSR